MSARQDPPRRRWVIPVTCSLAALGGLAVAAWQWGNARDSRRQAVAAHEEARRLEDAMPPDARVTRYFHQVGLAVAAWLEGQFDGAVRVLDTCEPEQRGWEWHCLRRLCRPELLRLDTRSAGILRHLSLSPDGTRLAAMLAPSGGAEVRVWDTRTGQELLKLPGPDRGTVAFSADGLRLAFGGKLWDASSGKELRAGLGEYLAFSPDGRWLASLDRQLHLCDPATGEERVSYPGPRAWNVASLVFSPDGKHFATAGTSRENIRVWDTGTGEELRSLEVGNADMRCVAFSPDGERLAFAGQQYNDRPYGSRVHIVQWRTGKEALNLQLTSDGQHPGRPVTFSPDGRYLAACSSARYHVPGTVTLWDPVLGREEMTFRGHDDWIYDLAFSGNGRCLATASDDGTVRLWDVARGPDARRLQAHRGEVAAVAFAPEGRLLATAGADGVIRLWDPATGLETATLEGHAGAVQALAFGPHGKTLVSVGDEGLRVWDVAGGRSLRLLPGYAGLALSPDGGRVASLGRSGLRLWDTATGQEAVRLSGVGGFNVAFSPDGKRLATTMGRSNGASGDDHVAQILDAETGQVIYRLEGKRGEDTFFGVAFSPDGKRLAVACPRSSSVRVWDAESGRPLAELVESHSRGVLSVAYSPDGKRLAAGTWDGRVTLWDAATGLEIASLPGCQNPVRAVAFSPDGRWLATASDEESDVRLWDGGLETPETPERQAARQADDLAWDVQMAELAAGRGERLTARVYLDRVAAAAPRDGHFHLRRGRARAGLGQWEPALADLDRAVELQARQPGAYAERAVLAACTGDRERYRRACAELLNQFPATDDPFLAGRLAWVCCLAPGGVDDPAIPVRLAEQEVRHRPKEVDALLHLGAALFRAGKFRNALTPLTSAVSEFGGQRTTALQLVLALTYHRLGEAATARECLEKAQQLLADARDEDRLSWDRRLERQVLRAEAEATLKAARPETNKK